MTKKLIINYETSDGVKGYFIPKSVFDEIEIDESVGTLGGLLKRLLELDGYPLNTPIYLQQVKDIQSKVDQGFEAIRDEDGWEYLRPVGWLTIWGTGQIGINIDY